ncbi:MAG: CHAP domain-containing protein [Gorillibacterium sp.]|nr:CHAP domain-containing protein [Gorillibacterium sp.]
MMHRLETIRSYVNQIISGIDNPSDKENATIHLYGVSSVCAILALKRGLDAELAAIAGLLHELYFYKTGVRPFHQHSCAEMMRPILREMGQLTANEQQLILSAIYHHGDQAHIHDPYDEILKDADAIQPFLFEAGLGLAYSSLPRLMKVAKELGLQVNPEIAEAVIQPLPMNNIAMRNHLADLAEERAARHIVGIPEDHAYRDITHYWPDDHIEEVLKNGWCAAFVYHCCMQVGFNLPIRMPHSPCRLAGVVAWYEWAKSTHCFIQDAPDVLPQRGDIVVYHYIIPPENKPEEQRETPTDHIGIVLSCDENGYVVAEGNVNNNNVSGIVNRPLHENIEGFIRIDSSYEYDGWKYDYKTGQVRVIPLSE